MPKSYHTNFSRNWNLCLLSIKIILFGSRAKGTNQEPDIDLAIEGPLASSAQWNQVMEIIENADTLLKIDCVRLDKIQNKRLKLLEKP